MVLTKIPSNDLFDLSTWVGQRQATFSFKLINGITDQPLGDLHPNRDSPPTLTHDTSRTIPRTFELTLNATDMANIDTVNNRILVYMTIGGRDWPLGRYMFINKSKLRFTYGTPGAVTLADEMFIIDNAIETGFSSLITSSLGVSGFGDIVTPLEQIDQTMRRLLKGLGITARIDATPYTTIGSWIIGTSRAQILNNLSVDGDYFAPWMNNDGQLRIMRTYDPAREVPDFDFDSQNKVIAGSIIESDNILEAPNRIIVVSNGTASDVNASAPIVGTFDVPLSAPHSIFNRGFVVPKIYTRQVESSQQAMIIARNIALRDTAFETVQLSTPPDPRHDSYNVIRWDNKQWLETRWTMELIEGGTMRHSLQRVYL